MPNARPEHPGRRPRPALQVERLEDRCLMDGAGFVHTDPDEDPGSVVGVAEILAQNDYVSGPHDASQILINPLVNDPLPAGSTQLRIKSVSASARGASVAISDDGQRIVYTPPEGGVSWDSFYYIVEDEHGKLGKANVSITGTSFAPTLAAYDRFQALEDGGEVFLHVLANDGQFADGEIVAVTAPSRGGTVRIADDGKGVYYKPAPGYSGYDSFQYTVRAANGDTATGHVEVDVNKPYRVGYDDYRFDVGLGPTLLNVLANDSLLGPTPETPRIVAVTQPLAGTLSIADDGQKVLFTPAPGYIGNFSFEYTVQYGPAEYQRVSTSVHVRVDNTFLAVDDWVAVDPGSGEQTLDVLRNDPILDRWHAPDVTLRIVAATAGNHGGAVSIDPDTGALRYTPAAGFVGDETFSYTVEDSTGHRDTATVTVHVGDAADGALPRFTLPGELEQYLIDQAVARYKGMFGVTHPYYQYDPSPKATRWHLLSGGPMALDFSISAAGYSETNTQEAGVDEADIVETDGRYLYSFSGGKLAIVDLADPENPTLVSLTAFDDWFDEMYLQGGRLTLIARGAMYWGDGKAVVATLDISDPADPTLVERTEIDGFIVDTRAVGDRVHVAVMGLELPAIESKLLPPAGSSQSVTAQRYETLDEYVSRVRATLIDAALPTYRTYDAAGQLVAEGQLVAAADIHKPVDDADDSLLALVTFDVSDGAPGPDASAGIFTSAGSEVYMSGNAFYVLRNHDGDTAIFKFTLDDDGAPVLAATGTVDGWLLNQFSVDEHDGKLRIATTGTVEELVDGWRREVRRANNLFVLEQVGAELIIVGAVENLAPTETIKSVRFLDDRAYVVTFRVVDPLFAIDLSDPTAPTVEGALKIPGYSDYLHPVGENYVVGIGRDANEITGALGLPQISLFYVGDLANPVLVDQVTMEGAEWAFSEAWQDHHAFAYFAENQLLTIPVSWHESVAIDDDGDGMPERYDWQSGSAVWGFLINVNSTGGGAIEIAGRVEHDAQARRSVRIGDSLITISDDTIKIHDIEDFTRQLGELYLGPLPTDDQFTVDEDSGATVIDVRANDRPGVDGAAPRIVSVTQPTANNFWIWSDLQTEDDEAPGTVEISPDGKSLMFTPAADFFGTVTFSYTVRDELHGDETANVTITVEPVADAPRAVDDEYEVDPDSGPITLDVLANDSDPDARNTYGLIKPYPIFGGVIDVAPLVLLQSDSLTLTRMAVTDTAASSLSIDRSWMPWIPPALAPTLKITEVSAGSHGGAISIAEDGGSINYQPAGGFAGDETFTYTIKTGDGRTAVATVTMHVGSAAPETPLEIAPLQAPVPDVVRERVFDAAPAATELATTAASSTTAPTPIELPSLASTSVAASNRPARTSARSDFRPALRATAPHQLAPLATVADALDLPEHRADHDDALAAFAAIDPRFDSALADLFN